MSPTEETTEPTGDVVSRAEFSALQEELLAAKAKKTELESDLFSLREERRKSKEAADATRREAGDLEPLLKEAEERAKKFEERLLEMEGPYKARLEWEKSEAARIEAEAEGLPDKAKAILQKLPIDDRRDYLETLFGSGSKDRPPEHPATTPSNPAPSEYSEMTPEQKREKRSGWRGIAPVASVFGLGGGGKA